MSLRRGAGLVIGLAATSLVLSVCNSKKKEEAVPAQLPFSIYFTCDTNGRIEPCGCFTGQFGGLTRVSTVLKGVPADALRVEVGNAIAGLEDYHVIQYRYLLQACAAMEYDAVNVGEREARLPAARLRDLAAKSPVPLLAANVLDATTREPVAARHTIADHGSLKVGIVGVVDPDSLRGETDASVEISSMGEALRASISELKDKTQILVCLAFTNEEGMENLAREFYEFDIVLGGDVRQPSSTLGKVNQSLILATTNQARALGQVGAVFDTATGQFKEPAGDVSLMVDSIPEDPAIRLFSTNYRKEIRDTVLKIDTPASQAENRIPGVKPAATFVGSMTCAGCHPKAFATWSKSGHSHAFKSIVQKDSDADPSCIKCHVIGFGDPGGYTRKARQEHLKNVGCESCHGPASEHVRLRSAAKPGEDVLVKMRPVGKGQCIQCHYGEFSRPFTWEEFWPSIAHGKE